MFEHSWVRESEKARERERKPEREKASEQNKKKVLSIFQFVKKCGTVNLVSRFSSNSFSGHKFLFLSQKILKNDLKRGFLLDGFQELTFTSALRGLVCLCGTQRRPCKAALTVDSLAMR